MDFELNILSIEEEEESVEIVDEVEDDDTDAEEDDEGVTLGFVEKPKNPNFLLRQFFPSKAGGVPAWLIPKDLPSEKSRTCGFCKNPLQFLLQTYAPISEIDSAFHRMLYVFMCPSMTCLLEDQRRQQKHGEESPRRSVKVFRCQLLRMNPFYSSEPPKRDGTDTLLTRGAALCCWCGTWTADKVCSGCKRSCYCSKEHQAIHWRSGHKYDCTKSAGPSVSVLGKGEAPAEVKAACKTLYPEFEIVVEDECTFDIENTEDKSHASSIISVQDKTDETFQLLSDKFEAGLDKEKWASFQQRIAKAPEQVLRYCRDLAAKPLWPLASGCPLETQVPRCKYCEGPLCYEFQIMPQLLYYFSVRNDPDSLDWATIVIYTCLASCEASVNYKEEFAWVQLYPTGTIP